MHFAFLEFLSRCKPGCRLLTYNSLETMHADVCARLACATPGERKVNEKARPSLPWRRMSINTLDDKFDASWGHIRFHLYTCIAPPAYPRTRLAASTRSPISSPANTTASTSTNTSPSDYEEDSD
jgi:hypothetical protein